MRINDIYIFYQNELKTVSIRQRVKGVQNLPEAVSSAINALQAYAEASGALLAGMPFCCYYNQDMSDLDVEFGFPVDRVLPANGDIKSSTIPAGKYVKAMYMGPYEEIEPFYHEVFGWIADKQLMPLGTMHELYYNSPDTTAREHLLTEMMVAIKN